jgi:disulfide oxidoreductase YuzD
MEDMSTRSGNKLTEEQIEQLIKRLRGVEHIEPIVTIEDSNVNNEKNGDAYSCLP